MLGYICKIRFKVLLAVLIVLTSSMYVLELYFHYRKDAAQLPVLVWWTPFTWESRRIINCGQQQCVVSKQRSLLSNGEVNSLLFYGSRVNVDDLPLPKQGVTWAVFHEESPKNLGFFNHAKGQQLFDIFATFSRFSDMPVTFQYLKNINLLTDLTYYKSLDYKNSLLKDIAPVLYVQKDCQTPIQRDKYVQELMQYIEVDSYGECLNNKKMPEKFVLNGTYDLYEDDFMHFVSQYKFVVAIENAKCQDYITEKLWRPLIVGSIPIYLGSPTVEDWLPNEKTAILVQDFTSIKEMANFIHKLNNNDKLYEEYLHHKTRTKVLNNKLVNAFSKGSFGIDGDFDDVIPAFECYVCGRAHKEQTISPKDIADIYNCQEPEESDGIWRDHWRMGKCQAKALDYLIHTLKVNNITIETYENVSTKFLIENDCD